MVAQDSYTVIGVLGLGNLLVLLTITIWRLIRYLMASIKQEFSYKKLVFHIFLILAAVMDLPMYCEFVINQRYTLTTYSFHKFESAFLFAALSITISDWGKVLYSIQEYNLYPFLFRRATLVSINLIYWLISIINFIFCYTLDDFDSYTSSALYTICIFFQVSVSVVLIVLMLSAGLKLAWRIHGVSGSNQNNNNSNNNAANNNNRINRVNNYSITGSSVSFFTYRRIEGYDGQSEFRSALWNLNVVMGTCAVCLLMQAVMLILDYALGYVSDESKTVGPTLFYWTCYFWLPMWGVTLSLLYLSRTHTKRQQQRKKTSAGPGGTGQLIFPNITMPTGSSSSRSTNNNNNNGTTGYNAFGQPLLDGYGDSTQNDEEYGSDYCCTNTDDGVSQQGSNNISFMRTNSNNMNSGDNNNNLLAMADNNSAGGAATVVIVGSFDSTTSATPISPLRLQKKRLRRPSQHQQVLQQQQQQHYYYSPIAGGDEINKGDMSRNGSNNNNYYYDNNVGSIDRSRRDDECNNNNNNNNGYEYDYDINNNSGDYSSYSARTDPMFQSSNNTATSTSGLLTLFNNEDDHDPYNNHIIAATSASLPLPFLSSYTAAVGTSISSASSNQHHHQQQHVHNPLHYTSTHHTTGSNARHSSSSQNYTTSSSNNNNNANNRRYYANSRDRKQAVNVYSLVSGYHSKGIMNNNNSISSSNNNNNNSILDKVSVGSIIHKNENNSMNEQHITNIYNNSISNYSEKSLSEVNNNNNDSNSKSSNITLLDHQPYNSISCCTGMNMNRNSLLTDVTDCSQSNHSDSNNNIPTEEDDRRTTATAGKGDDDYDDINSSMNNSSMNSNSIIYSPLSFPVTIIASNDLSYNECNSSGNNSDSITTANGNTRIEHMDQHQQNWKLNNTMPCI